MRKEAAGESGASCLVLLWPCPGQTQSHTTFISIFRGRLMRCLPIVLTCTHQHSHTYKHSVKITMAAALAFTRRCRCFLALASSSSSSPLAHSTKAQTLTTLAGAPNRRRILLPAPPTSTSQAAAATAPFSTKAPAAKKGKKGGDDAAGGGGGGEAPIGDTSKVAPVNIYKEGKDPPLLPDDQYPEWLFEIRVGVYICVCVCLSRCIYILAA